MIQELSIGNRLNIEAIFYFSRRIVLETSTGSVVGIGDIQDLAVLK